MSKQFFQKSIFVFINCIIFLTIFGFFVFKLTNQNVITSNTSTNTNISISQRSYTNEQHSNVLTYDNDSLFDAEERARFWKEKGFNFDPNVMTAQEMNQFVFNYQHPNNSLSVLAIH